jgi:chaperonin cofactor prefoldin
MDETNGGTSPKAEAMETEEELNKQLEDILTRIDKARRELKALRGHPAEAPRGKPGASFFAGKERMIEAAEAEKRLDTLKQQEREIRAKLHPDSR